MDQALQGRRDKIVLATKWGNANGDMGYGPAAGAKGGRKYLRVAVENSLRRLQTDYIDLYQMHSPDPVTPIEETLAALTELVNEGKVRYVGSSNFAGWETARADHVARENGFVPLHLCAEPLLVARARHRDRGHPGLRGVRAGHAAVLPPGERTAHRQGTP